MVVKAPPPRETPEEAAPIRAAPAVTMVAPEAVVPLQIRVALAAVGTIAALPIQQNPEEEAGAAPIRATLEAATPEAESRTGEALPTRTP